MLHRDCNRIQNAPNFILQRDFELLAIGKSMAQRSLAQPADNLVGRHSPDVGGEQRKLQIVQRGLIDLARKRNHGRNRAG